MSQGKLIGCRLPHGLIIRDPLNPAKSVQIAGMNSSKIIGAPYVTTIVPAEMWDMFVASNPKFPALKNRALFECKDEKDAEAKGMQYRAIKTGLEPMKKEVMGVKPADKD